MAGAEYAPVGDESIALEDRPPSLIPDGMTDDSDSDVSYLDNLEDEPFEEKDRRFQDEPNMEDGDGEEYPLEPRRVSGSLSQV